MDNLIKEQLMWEYIKRFKYVMYWPLKIAGFCRFDIKNGKIMEIRFPTLMYKLLILVLANSSVAFLLYIATTRDSYIKLPDGINLVESATFANLVLLNSAFLNRRKGLELIDHCIEIDAYLGVIDTYFMRDAAGRIYILFSILIATTQVSVGVFFYVTYKVPIAIHIVGSFYFGWLFFAYYDYCVFLMLYSFITLRVRYLNVALIKLGNINAEYLPRNFLFNILLWKKRYDDLIIFQTRAGRLEFNMAFKMLLNQLLLLQSVYSFPIILGVWTVVMGTFMLVQMFIIRFKSSAQDVAVYEVQTYVITGWFIMNWCFMILVTLVTDMLSQQIEQTKLICSYIQLRSNNSVEIFKLTKSVLRTVQIRDACPSIYSIFRLDTGLILRIAASTLVYITVQLQLAFPKLPQNSNNRYGNFTVMP